MSTWEFLLVSLAVAGSAGYLCRRLWLRWKGDRGCCGGCPAVRPKIRLAAGDRRDSISPR